MIQIRPKLIRDLLSEGNVHQTSALLGRPYHMCGYVVRGDKRGREIGIPTANVDIHKEKLWPANGVYATRTWVMDVDAATSYPSVTNIGFQPTVNGSDRRLETHLLDYPVSDADGEFTEDLYGKRLYVEFIERLRNEQRFAGLNELVQQIRSDIIATRQILAVEEPDPDPFFIASFD